MILIGDIGGFNGAIIMFPAFLLAWYSERMYQSSVYQELPVKKKIRRASSHNFLQKKIICEQSFDDGLELDLVREAHFLIE